MGVACDLGYPCAKFRLPRPFGFRVRADVGLRDIRQTDRQTDGQTDGRRTPITALCPLGGGIIIYGLRYLRYIETIHYRDLWLAWVAVARHRTRRCMSTGDVLRTVFDDVGPSSAALSRRRFSYQGLRAVTKRILLF